MIAPLEYSGLVWVIGWDLAFWGQLPDGYTCGRRDHRGFGAVPAAS